MLVLLLTPGTLFHFGGLENVRQNPGSNRFRPLLFFPCFLPCAFSFYFPSSRLLPHCVRFVFVLPTVLLLCYKLLKEVGRFLFLHFLV